MEEIEDMFRSMDKELIKLAQKLCHSKRISYYLYIDHYIWTYWDSKSQKLKRNGSKNSIDFYSLNEYLNLDVGNLKAKYKINLK